MLCSIQRLSDSVLSLELVLGTSELAGLPRFDSSRSPSIHLDSLIPESASPRNTQYPYTGNSLAELARALGVARRRQLDDEFVWHLSVTLQQ